MCVNLVLQVPAHSWYSLGLHIAASFSMTMACALQYRDSRLCDVQSQPGKAQFQLQPLKRLATF